MSKDAKCCKKYKKYYSHEHNKKNKCCEDKCEKKYEYKCNKRCEYKCEKRCEYKCEKRCECEKRCKCEKRCEIDVCCNAYENKYVYACDYTENCKCCYDMNTWFAGYPFKKKSFEYTGDY